MYSYFYPKGEMYVLSYIACIDFYLLALTLNEERLIIGIHNTHPKKQLLQSNLSRH